MPKAPRETPRKATRRLDTWKTYDPEKVRRALAKTAGSWADLDIEKLIASLYQARIEGSRASVRE